MILDDFKISGYTSKQHTYDEYNWLAVYTMQYVKSIKIEQAGKYPTSPHYWNWNFLIKGPSVEIHGGVR
jgi:hypothetical protein